MTENSTMSTTAPPPITTTTASSVVNNSVNSLSLMWDWWCNFGVYVVAAGPLLNEDLTQTFLNIFSQLVLFWLCRYIRCYYITVDFTVAASQNGFSTYKLFLQKPILFRKRHRLVMQPLLIPLLCSSSDFMQHRSCIHAWPMGHSNRVTRVTSKYLLWVVCCC